MKDKTKQSSNYVIILCWLAYTVAYIGRLNFNAYIEPIRTQLGASKTELGLVSSFFFFSYGAGQLIHGILSKKYNTRYSVAVALAGSAAVNFTMTFCSDAAIMKYVWLFNGFFQSILWSSVVKTLADRLSDEMLPKAIVVMSTPPAFGTFIAYGMSALLSSLNTNYKIVFYIPAFLLTAGAVLWFVKLGKADAISNKDSIRENKLSGKEKLKITPAFAIAAVMLILTAISNGFIKDGITTWTPSILKERYSMNESLSILITVVLPLIAIGGSWLSTALHGRLKRASTTDGLFYFAETVILLLVVLIASKNSLKSPFPLIALFCISAMLMSAVNNVITSIVPLYLRSKMESGFLAGVLDTFCYVGSTLSTGLLGYIADRNSWDGVFKCLLIFGAAAFVFCLISMLFGEKNENKKEV